MKTLLIALVASMVPNSKQMTAEIPADLDFIDLEMFEDP